MKVNRHAKIVELIRKYDIETQEELAERLNEAGFKVTPVSYTHLGKCQIANIIQRDMFTFPSRMNQG